MECAEAARLLGIAWVGVGLYPDPASQDAFRRVAVDLALLTEPIDFEPGPDELRCRREPLPELGAALKRLTAAAFAHRVSVIRLHPSFSPEHLASFLQLLALDPTALEGTGGLAAAVRARELVGIEVALQTSLVDSVPGMASSDSMAVSMLVERLGAALPDVGGASYVEQFADVVESRPEEVAAYLEAFTRLDKEVQESIIGRLMGESARELQEIFLNQLAGHELAELGATLGPQAATFLADYVEYSTGHRGVEAEAAVLDPSSLLTFRTEVAARVNSRLHELDVTGFAKTIEMPPKSEWAASAQEALRGLFLVEERKDKLERAGRVWNRLVLASVRRGSFSEALGWFEVGASLRGVDQAAWATERDRMASAVLPTLVLAATAGSRPAKELLGVLAPGHLDTVVAALEVEELDGKRDVLLPDIFAWLAGDPQPVVDVLASLDRAVPAALTLLKKCGMDATAESAVRERLTDPRPEVRLSALEVSAGLSVGELAAHIDDSSGPVRRHVQRRLAADGSPEAIGVLAGAIAAAEAEEQLAIAGALAKTTEGVAYLRSLGTGWRALLTAKGRAEKELVAKVLRR